MDIDLHLLPTRIRRAEHAHNTHFLVVPPGVTPDHVVDPDFWAHLAARFEVNDRIEVIAEDGTFDGDLRVIAIDPSKAKLWAQVRVLRMLENIQEATPTVSYPDADGYTVEFSGPMKWRIMRGTDLIRRDFATEGDAVAALAKLKALKPQAKAA